MHFLVEGPSQLGLLTVYTHLWRDAECPRPLSIQRLDHLLYLSCLNCMWPGEDLEYRAWGRLGLAGVVVVKGCLYLLSYRETFIPAG